LIVDIGAQGRHSDGGIFKNSAMGQRFYNNNMYLPAPSAISARHQVPYVIVADEAFQLNSFTMRPYSSKNLTFRQRIFNYRLSRARLVSENPYAIWVSRWRILGWPPFGHESIGHEPLTTLEQWKPVAVVGGVQLSRVQTGRSPYFTKTFKCKP